MKLNIPIRLFRCAATCFAFAINTALLNGDDEAEIKRLDPFQVTERAYDDYLPSEASTGTRYAASMLEIPFPVSVISSEFIEDFKVYDYIDALEYVSGFYDQAGTGVFVLRGIQNTSNFKNGVLGGFVYGPASVERVEVVKGSNASVYGQTEPTGLINTITKQANLDRRETSLSGAIGTDNYHRWNLDTNIPVVDDKFGIRIAAQQLHTEHKRSPFFFHRRNNVYGTARLQITDDTWVSASIDHVHSRVQVPGLAAFVLGPGNVRLGVLGLGEYREHFGFDQFGPASINEIWVNNADLQLHHRFNEIFSARVYLATENRKQRQFRVQGGGNWRATTEEYVPRRGFTARSDPRRDGAQVDLLSHFWTGPVEHKLLITLDYLNDYNLGVLQLRRQPTLPALTFDNPVYYNFDQTYYHHDPDFFNFVMRDADVRNKAQGFLISERAAFMNGRLIAMAGIRYDQVETDTTDRQRPAGDQRTYIKESDTTYQTGLLYRVTPEVSLYASYSESFTPQRSETVIDINGQPFSPFRGRGFDAGVKASLRENTMNFTIGVFDVSKDNIGRPATDELGDRLISPGGFEYFISGEQSSRGFELDYNITPVPGVTFFGNYAYIDAKWSKVPDMRHLPPNLSLEGVPPARTPTHSLAFGNRISLDRIGARGLSVRYGIIYTGETIVADNIRDADDNFFYAPSITRVDAGMTYNIRRGGDSNVRHRFDINVKNLFDREYLVNRRPGDKRTFIGTYTLSF